MRVSSIGSKMRTLSLYGLLLTTATGKNNQLLFTRCGNKAAILKVGYNLERTFDIFNAVPESSHSPHPKTIVPYFL
jgi:hypothetical protein